jgi:uncharacterized membrane protein
MLIEKCDICGKLSAVLQVCRLCKRRVCDEHFKHQEGVCLLCYRRLSQATQATEETMLSATPFKLFFLGFFLMFAGVIVLFIASAFQGNTSVSGGLLVFIGPFPIILGAGPHAFLAIFLAAVLTIVGFVVFFWLRRTRA